MRTAIVVSAAGMLALVHGASSPLAAQSQPKDLDAVVEQQMLKAPPGDPAWRKPPTGLEAAEAGDVAGVIFNWRWYMGMLRSNQEIESIASLELRKSTGTVYIDGQPCTLKNYRASINYQVNGMRTHYSCTLPNGQSRERLEVVSGQNVPSAFAWDEDVIGAGLIPGRGTATPKPDALSERLIRLWSGPQGAVKAAHMGGTLTKVTAERGKPVVTFPIPGVQGAIAKATLNGQNQAERVEVRHGTVVTEFTYDKYADYNPEDDKVDGFFPGRIVEKRNGTTVLDLNVVETHVGNMYVVMPVPPSIRGR
jgi:hypothetical protein